MADQKTSELSEKTTLVDADYFPVVDTEASPIETKRVLRSNLASRLVWKAASENALTDADRTATITWTDLDLTAYTSAEAKAVVLRYRGHIDSISGGNSLLAIRKNGTTPAAMPIRRFLPAAGDAAGAYCEEEWIVGMDTGQVIEYTIIISGTIQVDTTVDVLGYFE